MEMNDMIRHINSMTSVDDLRTLNHCVCDRMKILAARKVRQFRRGQSVLCEFSNGTRKGVVEKINQKTVQVKVGLSSYRFSPNYLKPDPNPEVRLTGSSIAPITLGQMSMSTAGDIRASQEAL